MTVGSGLEAWLGDFVLRLFAPCRPSRCIFSGPGGRSWINSAHLYLQRLIVATSKLLGRVLGTCARLLNTGGAASSHPAPGFHRQATTTVRKQNPTDGKQIWL